MPLFFFDMAGPDTSRPDTIGLPCESLEAAYLELYQTLEIDAPTILARRENPFAYTYFIRDAGGRVLMDVPFSDLLAGRAAMAVPRPDAVDRHVCDPILRSHELRARANQVRTRARLACERARMACLRSQAERNRAAQVRFRRSPARL